jgi:hypothetical protein
VSIAPAAKTVSAPPFTLCSFTLTNTGKAETTPTSLHPQDATAYLNSDIYRLSVSVDGKGWSAQLSDALAAVQFGGSILVPVYASQRSGSSTSAKVTLKAVSESDPTIMATATCVVSAANSKLER